MSKKSTYEELENRVRTLEKALSVKKQAEAALRESEERARRQRTVITELALEKTFADIDLKRSFEKMCEFLSEAIDVARTSIWVLSDDGSELRCVSLYEADSGSHSHGAFLNAKDFPEYFDTIKTESRLSSEDVQNDPRTRNMTENYLRPLGITSMLDAGIVMDGTLLGVVCAEHIGEKRRWHSDEEAFLNIVAAFAAQRFAEYNRRQAEEALKESQQTFDSIIRNVPDIIYRLDPEGKITFVSEAVRKYGYSPESLTGIPIGELIHPNDRFAAEQLMLERKSGAKFTINLEVRLAAFNSASDKSSVPAEDREWIPFHVLSEGLYSGDTTSRGSLIGTQGIARDISRIRHFEQEVDRLAAVVEQAAEDVVITDPKGIIQYVNPRLEEVTGYTLAEVLGKTPSIFKSGKQDAAFYAELWGTITQGKIWKGRIWNKIKNGSIILQDVTITPIFDAGGKLTGYASVRRDITEQHRIQEQLQQAQKMNAIGTLAGGVAHDFNNILSGIIGFTELALFAAKDRPFIKEKLERVLAAGDRAAELVKQILSFSRNHKSEVKPVSPADIAMEVIKLMRASLPSTIEITHFINSENYVLADATNIHQVLMNLCTNAAHAMQKKGGVLSVSLQDVTLDRDDIPHRPDALPGDYIKISVEDTGTGMTKEVQEKAFDPFFTTKESGEGTGMGLSTVHGIITELDGFVSLYSEPDQGTSIHVFIPLIPKPAEIEIEPADQSLQGGTERILLVDDEEFQVDLLEEMLMQYGYQVSAFLDSSLALAHFQQNPYDFDLVITDMTMPKMTGDILTQKIHLKRPDIPVIMCTGFSNVMDEQKAKALGIHAFMYKPVVLKNILETIRKVMDSL